MSCKGPSPGRLPCDADISPLKPPGSADHQAKDRLQVMITCPDQQDKTLAMVGTSDQKCDKFILHGLGWLIRAQCSPASGPSRAAASYAVL